ncbi:MAG: nucleoside triphosphate pyrophosphohydrolase family protein [Actinobacteria bacterium]|nr:nucleoside triphosphate pyrophosphohydrolase family protein [Actinomycetota bacterium]MCA1806311.1 nucleoside triphosphate pyrophosphohydrolase family protein [Actinomycetota bacterium]
MDKFNDYQTFTGHSARYPKDEAVNYCVLGLAGEAGEVADKWKKVIRDKVGELDQETTEALAFELGDVLWYVARCAAHLGYDLATIAQMNQDKLISRIARDVIAGSGDAR